MYGTEQTDSGNQENSLYALDGSTPHLSQESMTINTSNVLLYVSPLLRDARHTLTIQNLAPGGEVLTQLRSRALTLKLDPELELDYFEVTGSTVQGGESILACEYPSTFSTLRGTLTETQPLHYLEAYIPETSRFNQQSS